MIRSVQFVRSLAAFIVASLALIWSSSLHGQSSAVGERVVSPSSAGLHGRTVWAFATTGTGRSVTTFAATDGGLYRSQAPNGIWSSVSAPLNDIKTYSVRTRKVRGVETLFLGSDKGVYLSRDNGATWQNPERAGAGSSAVLGARRVYDIATMENAGGSGILLVATDKGVYRSQNDGATWQEARIDKSLEDVAAQSLTVDGDIVVANFWEYGLWFSEDMGSSWKKITIAGENVACRSFISFESGGRRVWLAGSVGGRIWRSEDKGSSWKLTYQVASASRISSVSPASGDREHLKQAGVDALTYSGNVIYASTPTGIAWSRSIGRSWGHTRIAFSKAIALATMENMVAVGVEPKMETVLTKSSNQLANDSPPYPDDGAGYYTGTCPPELEYSGTCTPNGGGSNGGGGNPIVPPNPVISSVNPTQGIESVASFFLTIQGNNFSSSQVEIRPHSEAWNWQKLAVIMQTQTEITAVIPEGIASAVGQYRIRVFNGTEIIPTPETPISEEYSWSIAPAVPALHSLQITPNPALTGQTAVITLYGSSLQGTAPSFEPASAVETVSWQVSADGGFATLTIRVLDAGSGSVQVRAVKTAEGGGVFSQSLSFSVANAVPSATSLQPTSVLSGQNASFSLVGADFVPGATVLVNGSSAPTQVSSSSQLSFSFTPNAGGEYNVAVLNPSPGGGASTQTLTFTALIPPEAPTITSVHPSTTFVRGSAGEEALSLTVTGTNFEATSRLTVAGTQYPAPPSGNSFTVNVPASALLNAGQIAASVFTPQVLGAGGGLATGSFKALYDAPTLTALTPASIIAGGAGTLALAGTGFAPASQILWNGAVASGIMTYASRAALNIALSGAAIAQPGAVDISVSNPQTNGEGGGISGVARFLIQNPVPVISALTPHPIIRAAENQAAVSVVVTATGAVNNSVLMVDGQEVPTTVNGSTLQATIPASLLNAAKNLSVVVRNKAVAAGEVAQTESAALTLPVVNPKPNVTAIGALPIVIGSLPRTLTLVGTDFIEGATLRITAVGGSPITVVPTSVSPTGISFSLSSAYAPRAGVYSVEVVNPDPAAMGGVSEAFAFTVQNPAPTIASVTPSPLVNYETTQELAIAGTGFIADASAPSTVLFGGRTLTVVPGSITPTSLRAYLPTRLDDPVGNQSVTVQNTSPGGGAATFSVKTIHPAPSVSGATSTPNPLEANQAATALVNGSNFVTGVTTVWLGTPTGFRQLPATVGTNEFNVPGSRITVQLQASDIPLAGNYTLEVRTPQTLGEGGGAAQVAVTVVNPLPTLTSVSPVEFNLNAANRAFTVTGTRFVGSALSSVSEVLVNGASAPTSYNSVNSLAATLSESHLAQAGALSITVLNPSPHGGVSEERIITVFNPQAVISTLWPDRATLNSDDLSVTLTGSDFIAGAEVLINGAAYPASAVSSNSLTFTMPAAHLQGLAGTRSVVVRNPQPSRGQSGAVNFTVQNPQPSLASLSQTVIPAYSEAQTLTLAGTDIIAGAVATWSKGAPQETPLATAVIHNASASVTIPAHLLTKAGTYTLTLENPAPSAGASNSLSLIVINRAPALISATPNEHLVGSPLLSVTLAGDFFAVDATTPANAAQAFWNGLPLLTTNQSRTSLTASVPASFMTQASVASLTVKNPQFNNQGGGESEAVEFTVKNPLPAITGVNPTFVVAGASATTVALNGEGFQQLSTVEAQDADGAWIALPYSFVNPTRLAVEIPSSLLSQPVIVNIRVTNPSPGGGVAASAGLTVRPPNPTLETLTPSTATLSGDSSSVEITLTGTGFVSSSIVRVGGAATPSAYLSPTQVRITLARPAGVYALSVRNEPITGANGLQQGGGTSQNRSFTLLNGLPVLSSLSPSATSATGSPFDILLEGENFVPSSRVFSNGAALPASSVVYQSPRELRATFPAAPITSATHSVRVENPTINGQGGGASATLALRITYPQPVLTSITPSSTSATARDWRLTVRGSLFAPASVVRVNGQDMTTEYVNATTLRASVPGETTRNAALYDVRVFTPASAEDSIGGGESAALQFSVNNPSPTLAAIAPAGVQAGTNATMTLTGTNFATNATVLVGGSAIDATTLAAVSVLSSTMLTVEIPGALIAASGSYTLRAVNPSPGGGQSGARSFVVRPGELGSAEFIGITTATLTTGQSEVFTIRYRDRFGNLVDTDREFVHYANESGSSAGTITLRRSSLGVSTATSTRFTVDGVYTFWLEDAPETLGNRTLTVQTGGDFFARFEGFQSQTVAGATVSSFRLTHRDRFGNLTDRELGSVTLRRGSASGSRVLTFAMHRLGEGLYESSPFVYTTSGTYYARVNGVSASNTSYVSSTGTVVEGESPSFLVVPAATIAEFRNVDGLLNTGEVQGRFRVVFRDMYDNRVNPGAINGDYGDMVVRFSNTTSASLPNSGQDVFAGSIPMRFINTGVYEADIARFFKAGLYSLAFDSIPTRAGLWAFRVRPRAASTVEIQNMRDTILAGEPQQWRLIFRDVHGNLTDATNTLQFAKAGAPSSTGTVQLQRFTIGVSEATVTRLIAAGSYTLSVSGIGASNIIGKRTFVVLGNPSPVLASLTPIRVFVDIPETLILVGEGFIPASGVIIDGVIVPTSYRTSTSIEAAIPRGFFTAAGTADVWIMNPAPAGGISAKLPLQVDNPVPVLTAISPDRIVLSGGQTTITSLAPSKNGTATQSLSAQDITGQAPLEIEGMERSSSGLSVYANTPNPFAEQTQIRYFLAEAAEVRIEISDARGQRVALLRQGKQPKGMQTADWAAAQGLLSGTYTARVLATFEQNGKTASAILRMSVVR